MKRKRFSAEQIVATLKQAEIGIPVAELIRKVGILEQTFYRWKKHYTGLEVDHVRQLKQLQVDNARLKRLVADLTLDRACSRTCAAKILESRRCWQVVNYLQSCYRVCERRACRVSRWARSRPCGIGA